MGTIAYMSPEQAQGNRVDVRTDLWSLGVLIYEMLVSKQPFQGEHELLVLQSIVRDEPIPLRELREQIPDAVVVIVERLLKKDPRERFQSAGELLSALRQSDQGESFLSWSQSHRERAEAMYGSPQTRLQ